MAREWVDSIKSVDGGSIKFEKRDSGIRIGRVDASSPPKCVLHTTESRVMPSFGGGVPHLAVGPTTLTGRPIVRQLIPFGWMGTALQNDSGGIETNRLVRCQIEQVGFTSRERWLPEPEMVVQLASIAAFLEKEFGVPRKYSYDPADMKTGIWAVEGNPWRKSGKFPGQAGWHPHAAVPENDHWDCGGEDVPFILGLAKSNSKVKAHRLVEVHWNPRTNHRVSSPISPWFTSLTALKDWTTTQENLRRAVWKELVADHKVDLQTSRVERANVRR